MPDFNAAGEMLTTFTLLSAAIALIIQVLKAAVPKLAGKERIISACLGVMFAAGAGYAGWLDVEMAVGPILATGAGLAMGSGVAYNQLMRMFQQPGQSKTEQALLEIRNAQEALENAQKEREV